MTPSYKLIIHKNFKHQLDEIIEKDKKLEEPLVTALREIAVNPGPGGLQGVKAPHLKGVLHKKHVSGNNGYRLIYIFRDGTIYIIPTFISNETRRNFSYKNIDWVTICDPIYQDFKNRKYDHFIGWKVK